MTKYFITDYFNHLRYVFPTAYYYDKETGKCTRLFYSQFLHEPKSPFLSKELCEVTCLS